MEGTASPCMELKEIFKPLSSELDPHGAYGSGNPVGGNVTSNITGSNQHFQEWMVPCSLFLSNVERADAPSPSVVHCILILSWSAQTPKLITRLILGL